MARATRAALLALCAAVLAGGGGGPVAVGPAIAAAQAAAAVVEGPARVVDGDTLAIGRERIRLYGVDAPESKQTCTDARGEAYACGAVAKEALAERVAAGGGSVRCSVREKDQYGRLVASCALPPANGVAEQDMGDFMVRAGNAVAYRKITKAYVPQEEAARAERAGIFAGGFTPPAQWRYEQRVSEGAGGELGPSGGPFSAATTARGGSAPAAAAAQGAWASGSGSGSGSGGGQKGAGGAAAAASKKKDGCLIKGNISSKGAKIYHLPTDVTYDATKIDLGAGERFFCSEEEAAAAGWRPSRAPTAAAPPMSNGAGRRR